MNILRIILFAAAIGGLLGGPAPAVAQDWLYTFREGDTFWSLCIKYSNKRGCWIELGKHNNISNGRAVQPGQIIRFPLVWLSSRPVVGRVVDVQGEVSYDEKSSGAEVPLRAGQPLLLGSRIVSGQGSSRITLGTGSQLLIRSHSDLQLNSLSTSGESGQAAELVLDKGDVDVEVKPHSATSFKIKTPAAIAAVRGTHYRVSSFEDDGAVTRSEVLAGAVEVTGVGATLVPAGFGVKAQQDKALGVPRELLPPPALQHKRVDAPLPIDIHWRADPGAVSWHVDLQHEGQLHTSYAVEDPQTTLSGLEEACYRLVVRAVDAEGFNGFESELPVCLVSRLPAPIDIVVSKSVESMQSYSVAWSSVPAAREYRVEVAKDSSFGTLYTSQMVTGPAADIIVPNLERFSVRVIALDEYSNDGESSAVVNYIKPDYITPAVAAAIFLLMFFL